MKKLLVNDLSNKIYLTNARQDKNNPDLFISVGEKQDFTNEAIKAVFQWFMNNFKDNECKKAFEVTFNSAPYILRMVKKGERKMTDEEQIEEMARSCCGRPYKTCEECIKESKKIFGRININDCESWAYARRFFNQGYRKVVDGKEKSK